MKTILAALLCLLTLTSAHVLVRRWFTEPAPTEIEAQEATEKY